MLLTMWLFDTGITAPAESIIGAEYPSPKKVNKRLKVTYPATRVLSMLFRLLWMLKVLAILTRGTLFWHPYNKDPTI